MCYAWQHIDPLGRQPPAGAADHTTCRQSSVNVQFFTHHSNVQLFTHLMYEEGHALFMARPSKGVYGE